MSSTAAGYKFKVAICGGGISGLCLAVALNRRCPDIKVELYEATDRFKEIGAGIMIWSRTWKIMELMGLAPELSKIAHAPPDGSMGTGFDYRRSDQPQEGFRFHWVRMPYGCIRFHRAHFLDIFVDQLPPNVARFKMKLNSYSQSHRDGPIFLNFSDGTTSTCDILIGADGIKSTIRAQMFQEASERESRPELLDFIKPVYTGTTTYRGLIPIKSLNSLPPNHRAIADPMMYCGKSKHVVSYSIAKGDIVNVVTFASDITKEGTQYEDGDSQWVTECPQQELLDCYANWEPEVEQLLQRIEKPTRWAIHHLKPLPFYVDGRVALIGDAAHAMSPHQGAGAGMAIEDAFVLAHVLEHATASTLGSALEAWQKVRLPFGNHVLRGSYESGVMYEFNSDMGDNYDVLGPAIEKQWHWVSETTPEDEVARASEYYKELSG
ncbi:FAD/NAD-binding domain-containing protein [Dendrothele bispora CBS 962.96]|uniref:FAD/NAD-binding domain-containing protein n=1 Tax=Dendrothele bispora (strain CBS 962.96) TaxID=1314807 RepID=A0A4S8M0R9_DENBC|nr:FAD/NAD-binding domain-containing protein [Dendrothele bispora CBS 962.96]